MKRHTDFHSHAQRWANADKQKNLPGFDTSLNQDARTHSPERNFSPSKTTFAETANGNRHLFPDEDSFTKLHRYPTKQLDGRLAHYKRKFDQEVNKNYLAEWKREVDATQFELRWRKMNPSKLDALGRHTRITKLRRRYVR